MPIRVIRELCDQFGLKPARGVHKVAIVDDADDLNDEAANAFLKTLEEPPPGAVLILIGTSAEVQLDTIVSRCRVVRFYPLPEAAGHRIISSTTAAALRHMLEGVLAPGGTASEVSIPGYQLAGKTGTASKIDPATGEYSKTAYIASFIGFAPASHPKLLCAVVVDEPQSGSIYGGTVAAPAFGQIMSFALPYLGVPPG